MAGDAARLYLQEGHYHQQTAERYAQDSSYHFINTLVVTFKA